MANVTNSAEAAHFAHFPPDETTPMLKSSYRYYYPPTPPPTSSSSPPPKTAAIIVRSNINNNSNNNNSNPQRHSAPIDRNYDSCGFRNRTSSENWYYTQVYEKKQNTPASNNLELISSSWGDMTIDSAVIDNNNRSNRHNNHSNQNHNRHNHHQHHHHQHHQQHQYQGEDVLERDEIEEEEEEEDGRHMSPEYTNVPVTIHSTGINTLASSSSGQQHPQADLLLHQQQVDVDDDQSPILDLYGSLGRLGSANPAAAAASAGQAINNNSSQQQQHQPGTHFSGCPHHQQQHRQHAAHSQQSQAVISGGRARSNSGGQLILSHHHHNNNNYPTPDMNGSIRRGILRNKDEFGAGPQQQQIMVAAGQHQNPHPNLSGSTHKLHTQQDSSPAQGGYLISGGQQQQQLMTTSVGSLIGSGHQHQHHHQHQHQHQPADGLSEDGTLEIELQESCCSKCSRLHREYIRPLLAELVSILFYVYIITLLETTLRNSDNDALSSDLGRILIVSVVEAVLFALFLFTFEASCSIHLNPAISLGALFSGVCPPLLCIFNLGVQFVGSFLAVLIFQVTTMEGSPILPELPPSETKDAWLLSVYRFVLCQTVTTAMIVLCYLTSFTSYYHHYDENRNRNSSPHNHRQQLRINHQQSMSTSAINIAASHNNNNNNNVYNGPTFRISIAGIPLSIAVSAFLSLLNSTASWNPVRSTGTCLSEWLWKGDPSIFKWHYIFWMGPIIGSLFASFFYRLIFAGINSRKIITCQRE